MSFIDGGYSDNLGIIEAVRVQQENAGSAQEINIVSIAESTNTANFKNLFEGSNVVLKGQGFVTVPQLYVFKQPRAITRPLPVNNNKNSHWMYTIYCLTSIENKFYGVKQGSSVKMLVFAYDDLKNVPILYSPPVSSQNLKNKYKFAFESMEKINDILKIFSTKKCMP